MVKNKKQFRKFFKKNLLLISGLVLISVFCIWRYHSSRILSFTTLEQEFFQNYDEGVIPVHIRAYPVGVDVEVKKAQIKDGVWTIYPKSAGYIRNENNLIIYGHNKDQLMGPIRYIKNDAQITLLGNDGEENKYAVIKTDTVEPDNLQYIQATNEDTLTIYTCIGFLDTKRFIVVAKRIN